MAQKRKKNNKKWISWVLIIILFVAVAVVCYLVWDNYFKDKKEDKSTEEQSLVEGKGGEENTTDQTEVVAEKEKVVLYEGEDPNTKDELTGVVTYAGVNGDNLMIRVNIDQYVAGGSCELSLIKNGSGVYNDTAAIMTAATTATCDGFNVPVNSLGTGGYQIVIKISADGKNGIINGEVNI